MISFQIPGKPVPKGRPRFASRGKYIRTYTPPKTHEYENIVRGIALKAVSEPFNGTLCLRVTFYIPLAKSSSKRLKNAIRENPIPYHDAKPDLDNLAKSIMDALNGIAYHDDGQVAVLACAKYWTADEPHTVVDIIPINEYERNAE